MGLYADQILPRSINLALRGGEFAGPRARAAAGLDGEVLEIGFGSTSSSWAVCFSALAGVARRMSRRTAQRVDRLRI